MSLNPYAKRRSTYNPPPNLLLPLKLVFVLFLATFLNTNASAETNSSSVKLKDNETSKSKDVKRSFLDVRGKVTNQQGDPLPDATILVESSGDAAVTDANGEFSISNVQNDDVLIVSYTGYIKQEVEVAGRTVINITLKEDLAQLGEVVVVGYGTQKKVNLTGAVGQVKGDDIALRPSANATSALQGLMPGLNIQVNNGDPKANPDVNIRGFNSINGGSPLVLVDGIEGSLSRVNPNDIESVSVLKDAASAAIYGARGAFGVILITTKAGRAGDVRVNYTNNFAWTTPTTRTDFINDPYVYGKTVDAALNGYNGTSYTEYNDLDWETIKMVANGEIEPFHQLQANGRYKFFRKTDWYDYLFRQWQPSQFHNISLSGGTEKLKAYLSGRIYDRATISNINHDADVKRYNLNANLGFKPVEWLDLSANIKYVHEDDMEYGGYRNGYGGIWSTTTWYDLFPFYPNNVDGIPADIGRGGSGGQGGGAAMEAGNNWRKWLTDELTNTFRAKVTPFKGLVLNMDYSNRIETQARTYRYNEFEYITTDRLEKQTVGINRLGEWRWVDKYNALNIFGTYEHDFSDHHFKLLLGYNQENFDRDRVAAQSNDLLIRDLANLALGTEMYNIDGSAMVWAVQGYFGRFNYDYKEKYLLEVNARYDGSSRFPKDSRWGFFPSVSAGWQMNKEDFWGDIGNTISSMKLRASYGSLGNQTVGVNTFQQLMKVGQSSWLEDGVRLPYAGAPNPLPKVVTWETTESVDFGVDFGLFANKFMVTFDWYRKETDGMYLPGQPLPGVFGSSEPRENYAALRNTGFELSLNYNNHFNVAGSPLRVSATASVSNFKGIITKYDNPQGLMSTYWEGQELGQLWGYRVDGQFQSDEEAANYQKGFNNPSSSLGQVYKYILNTVQNTEWKKLRAGDIRYVDVNGDGRIDRGDYTLENHGDLVPIGNAMPKFPFGFNINASWRGFDLAIAGAGVAKQDWYPTGDLYWGTYQRPYLSFLRKDLLEHAWTPENPGKYPQIERGYAALGDNRSLYEMNDYYLENVGFMRIKNLTVGYTLPKHITEKITAQKVRVYFSGENVFTVRFGGLTKYIDPEQAGNAIDYSKPGDAVGRSDVRDYPMGKTYSMGISITL